MDDFSQYFGTVTHDHDKSHLLALPGLSSLLTFSGLGLWAYSVEAGKLWSIMNLDRTPRVAVIPLAAAHVNWDKCPVSEN